jgi:alanine-glyoxylate transaminase / serine-glyoxylate transaminase / serine-pyruvate transaminase
MSTPRLLIPGPVDLDEDVLSTLGSQAIPHYGPAWAAIYQSAVSGLRPIFGTDGGVYPIVGSGSAGLDAAFGSLMAPGQRMLIARNGYFGDRLREIALAHGIEVVSVEAPWGEAIRVEAVRAALEDAGELHGLALVHAETSTGVLNPVAAIAELARERGLPVIVDAITALGGVELRVDEWGIDICVGASQKALAAPAGLAPVAVSRKGWAYMDANPVGPGSWYLNLRTWRRYAEQSPDHHPHPVTIPTGALQALALRVRQIHELGLPAYLERHARAARRFRAGLVELDLRPFVAEADATPQVTSVELPAGADAREVLAVLRERHQLLATGGLGDLSGRILRIGHMGKGASDAYVDAALVALADALGRR